MKWLDNDTFFFRRRLKKARELSVKKLFESNKRIWFKCGDEEVMVSKDKGVLNCTCREASVYPEFLCEHKIACIKNLLEGVK